MSILIVIFMYAAWSSVFSFGKLALENCPPLFLTGLRMTLAGVLLLGWIGIRNRKSLKIGKQQILPLLALSIFSIYLTNILEFWGLQYLTAAKACFIYSLSPFFAALFSYLHFGETMNKKKFIGMLIGFIGFLAAFIGISTSRNGLSGPLFSWPDLSLIGAALFSVYGWVLLRVIVKKQTLSPLYANGYSMLFGGVLAFIHSACVDTWTPLPITNHIPSVFKSIVIMICISNILCYNLYGFMLKKYTATFLSFMGLLSPIFASLNSWFVLGEALSWQILLSTGIISLGLFVVYQAELKQGYIIKNTKSDQKIPSI